MKLSVRISLTLALISMVISAVVALTSYFYQLDKATNQSLRLVSQLAQGAQRASAISAYIQDTELATEIISGLEINDLISHAAIIDRSNKIFAGYTSSISSQPKIELQLYSPFIDDDKVGSLVIYPNTNFIQSSATESSLQLAFLLLSLSLVTALTVGVFIRNKLTMPIRKLVDEFINVDVSRPNDLYNIDINYKKDDEIGLLIRKVNSLVGALQQQNQSEYELRKATEELQKRFRLLFEQSTAGIGLLDLNGQVTLANQSMNMLFGTKVEGTSLPSYFHKPELLREQLLILQDDNFYSQVSIDLVIYKQKRKRYLHCLLSTIKDDRKDSRFESEHLVEIIIYDVTSRREVERKAKYEAAHDSLTGLLNRRAGMKALKNKLQEGHDAHSIYAVLMIDLDAFKPINDEYGHDVGDLVLRAVSERLIGATADYSSLCIRWGGDEFIVGLTIDTNNALDTLCQQILHDIQQSILVNPQLNVSVGASIGCVYLNLADYKTLGVNLDDVIKEADQLMYDIKQTGKNNYQLLALNRDCDWMSGISS